MIASDALVEASGCGNYYWESDSLYLLSIRSLVVGKVTAFLVAVVKVATVLEVVDGKVAVLEGVVVKVASRLEEVET